jgi:beta-glucosidase
VLYDDGWPANYDVFSQTNFDSGITQRIFASRDWTGQSQTTSREHLNEDRIVTSKTGSIRWTARFTAPRAGIYYVIVHDGRVADHHDIYIDGKPLASPNTDLHGELYYLPIPRSLKRGETVELRMDYLPHDTEVYPGLGVLHEDDILSVRARAIATAADTVLIAAGFDKTTEHEGMDRTFDLPPLQSTMIRNITQLNPRTIVTLNAGGNVDMRS